MVDIYNTFCKALDEGKEVRAVFLDISKAFDRVWHKSLLFKLKQAGINSTLLQWLSSCLSDRKQRVLILGGSSSWLPIKAGVPQDSILVPLLFLIYINDIVLNVNSTVRVFADNTSLYLIVDNPADAARCLNSDLELMYQWAECWLVKCNAKKSQKLFLYQGKQIDPKLLMNNEPIKEGSYHKHLGIFISSGGTRHEHINIITSKAWSRVNLMRKLKFILDRRSLELYTYLSYDRFWSMRMSCGTIAHYMKLM